MKDNIREVILSLGRQYGDWSQLLNKIVDELSVVNMNTSILSRKSLLASVSFLLKWILDTIDEQVASLDGFASVDLVRKGIVGDEWSFESFQSRREKSNRRTKRWIR